MNRKTKMMMKLMKLKMKMEQKRKWWWNEMMSSCYCCHFSCFFDDKLLKFDNEKSSFSKQPG